MLKKSKRLTTSQFDAVMNKGRIVHSPLFLMRVLSGQSDTRIAAIASVKLAKKAVIRNRTRRLIYAAVRPLTGSLKKGNHILIFAKTLSIGSDSKSPVVAFEVDLKGVFAKAGLLE